MAVSGLPEPCTTHARDMARLALDMMDKCKSVSIDDMPVVSIKKNLIYLILLFIMLSKLQLEYIPVR